ncbi:MAG TPA: diacylglycerol kinase family protein [Candidatus Lokiarchaeia archaeon]|nr:diacylglycerol kinase family protein [Candidatus Lokiarchaeia archaeon]
MSFAFIVNPHSASGKTKKKWDSMLEPALKAKNVDYKVFFTEHREHAIQLAREALETGGFKNVVSVGGDGTFHEIVNGVLDSDGQMIKAGANVGIICSGTGSDFIKTLGIPQDPLQAIDILLKENVRTIDVLKGNFMSMDGNPITKFCINVADAGIGGDVVDRVNRSKKIFGGKATFMLAELRVIMGFKRKPISLQIDSEEPRDLELLQIFFSNCTYNGGGLRAGYKASPDDGWMDVFYMEGLSTGYAASNFSKLYKDDAIIEALIKKNEPHMFYTKAKNARLVPRNEKAVLLDFDGEMVGKAPLDIEIIPSAVNVLSP